MAKRIEVTIAGDASSLQRAVRQSETALGTMGSRFSALAKTAAFTAGAAGVGAIAITLRAGIKEYTESAKVAAQTNAVIKSTGGVANVTAGQVDKLADSLMKKSGVDDEAIKSSENLLLGFTNIRNEVGKGNDVFNQATAAVLDYSVRTGRDATGAAVMFGKALNDPISGLGKLARAGITFTDAQKDQIKALQESGDTMGAQKVILEELEKRYGGAAEAAGNTLPGQLNILKESFNNFAGDLVANAIPSVQRFVDFINSVIAAPTFKAKVQIVWEGIESAVSDLHTRLRAAIAGIDWANLFITGLQAINWGAVLMGVFEGIITVSKTQWTIVSSIWLGAWRAILTGLQSLGGQIIGAVTSAMSGAVSAVRSGGAQVVASITASMTSAVTAVRNATGAALSAATAVGNAIVNGVKAALAALGGVITGAVGRVDDIVRGFIGAARAAGSAVGSALISGIGEGIRAAVGGVIAAAVGAVHSIVGALKSAARIHSPSELMAEEVGIPLGEGIIDGLQSVLADNLPTNLSDELMDGVKKAHTAVADKFKTTGEQVAWDLKGAMDETLSSNLPSNLQGVFDAALAQVDWGGAMPGVSSGPTTPEPFSDVSPAALPATTTPITVNFPNYVGDKREIEDMVVGAIARRTGRQGFS